MITEMATVPAAARPITVRNGIPTTDNNQSQADDDTRTMGTVRAAQSPRKRLVIASRGARRSRNGSGPLQGPVRPRRAEGEPPARRRAGPVHRGVCVTTTLSESGVGRAASATAAAVSSNGNVCVTNDRTSKRREKTSRATSRWSVKSEE